ncbi:hypothetical protein RhiJN_16405 [Ceratobasidium sp. AG-Ba]|nr:hypothetical protein RhiJN_16405 [Ceratobasidium sp. AG-Ba]
MATVPRDEIKRKVRQIEEELLWRHDNNIEDNEDLRDFDIEIDFRSFDATRNGEPAMFTQVFCKNEEQLIPGIYDEEEWTYVIDLDNRAFTVNGFMHFNLDNMPLGSLNSHFEWVTQKNSTYRIPKFVHPPRTPIEHIATVARWPASNLDFSAIHNEYSRVAPNVLSIQDWGAPTWTTLSTAQQLSADLV